MLKLIDSCTRIQRIWRSHKKAKEERLNERTQIKTRARQVFISEMISSMHVLMETKIPEDLDDRHPLLGGEHRHDSSASATKCNLATINSGVDDYMNSIPLTTEDAIHKVNERLDRIEMMMVDVVAAAKGYRQ